ncbi:muramidase [Aspergillus brunneoviolaceus CBS 621.78]|uniref:Muramidase n=1 Tax=Aspergillus brunneoviolaceus CBS 621.78 TaxID=1450534 RepID=A0ACD1G7X5_9EURO|nr:muramidase [Aspergillus brunneoviolaceus CBS 621.78]RAH45372.1 muramidase [Aspergillus brunneoviolaceus CBS 621.78]
MRWTQILSIVGAGSLAGIASAAPVGDRNLEVAERDDSLSSRSTSATVTVSGLAVTSINNKDGKGAGKDSYTMYTGDGSTSAGWPAKSDWVSFENMQANPPNSLPAKSPWSANKATIGKSCAQFGVADNSATETQELYDAIQEVATSSKVDHRFILAVVMQESKGCVRAPTSTYSVSNPGLMQSYKGTGTCNNGGSVKNPCPKTEIVQMIKDGAIGTRDADGYGLASLLDKSARNNAAGFYRAARMYNSGAWSIPSSGNLSGAGATACYASDIANRLTGWVSAATKCTA